MVNVYIQKDLFPAGESLFEILTMRMASVQWREANAQAAKADASNAGAASQPIDAFLCSTDFAEKQGGMAAIVEMTRSMRAKKLMVIDSDADGQFHVTQEMNGKLIRVAVPAGAETQSTAQNYSLQMAATLLLDEDHVAVADPASRQLMALANRVAATDVTVFINGPTGTGKEVLARFIHNQSSRKDNAFVAVNCAAIPENMLEAILFGHEKGSFTGASTANKGIFRAADGGTLLLDEISEMPLSLQAKLLRALQERKVTPLGSQREIDVDVRVLATTNREMLQEIRDGKFREDLFYRLNVFPLSTQHLAQRPDDIVPISSILLARHSGASGEVPTIDDEAKKLLLSYGWPGNVRELENVLQRALVLSSGGKIMAGDIMVDGALQEAASSAMKTVSMLQQSATL
jgi:two-component system response regulator FlrC